jgi:fatty acid desaturase
MASLDRELTAEPAPSRPGRWSEYTQLSRQIKQAGLLDRRHGYYAAKFILNLVLLAAGGVAFVLLEDSWWQLLTAAYLAVVFTQIAFVGHDAGCSFAPNHKGMPTLTEAEELDFLRTQVLTSRNVRGSRLVDFLLGGLNCQIEHHLFPNMPRPNLRHAQPLVRAFCARHDLPYTEATCSAPTPKPSAISTAPVHHFVQHKQLATSSLLQPLKPCAWRPAQEGRPLFRLPTGGRRLEGWAAARLRDRSQSGHHRRSQGTGR